jgi:hypothetical protein
MGDEQQQVKQRGARSSSGGRRKGGATAAVAAPAAHEPAPPAAALFEAKRPLYTGLIGLYDRVRRSEDFLRGDEDAEAVLRDLREELLSLLEAEGVEPIRAAPGSPFDRDLQSAAAAEPADAPEDDWTVGRVVRDGFRCGARVLRPQSVVVRRWRGGPSGGDA